MKTIKGIWLHCVQLILLIFIASAAAAQIKADFTATPLTGCPPMVISFKDNSKGNPTSWKWDLGNGTISFEQNPIATYFTPGKYNIKLVASDGDVKDSIIKSEYIIVNALPSIYFSASDSTGCFPLKVQFKDSSLAGSGKIVKWQWDFGDGTLSNEQSPSHTYTSPGTFTVILRVTNSNGCSEVFTKPAFIKIQSGVNANFTYSSASGCKSPAPVDFANTTNGTGVITYKWDFGDGQTSNATNPTNNYNAGVYTVQLIASSSFGCADTMTKTNAINIGTTHADFSAADQVCANAPLQIKNLSVPPTYQGAHWVFSGDDDQMDFSNDMNPLKTFKKPGKYQIKLVADFGSCKDSITKPIIVLPQPTAAFSASNTTGCAVPLNVTFTDASKNAISYQWNFGDGSSSTLQNPVHPYTALGSYAVSLTVTNSVGCTATLLKDSLVLVAPLKIASISNLGISGCLPLNVSPVAKIKENLAIQTYSWDFGDGAISTDANPTHTYTTPGIFDVKLTVTTAEGCTDTYISKQAVKAGNKPTTHFSADPRDVCAFTSVNFTDESTGSIDQWLWYFGDGGSSALQNPKYIYSDTGFFNVTLITTNFGCSDTLKIKKYIHITPPIAKFDTSFLCNDPFKRIFVNHSIGATSYAWDFGDGAISTDENPSHIFSSSGTYAVSLTAFNDQCKYTVKKNVLVVKEHGDLSVSIAESCLNTRIIFKVKNIVDSNIVTYGWYFDGIPGNAIVTGNNPVAWSFSTPGVRPSAVVLTDKLKCRDTSYALVPVKSYGPRTSFGSNAPNTCFGNTIRFTDTTKTDGTHPITEYLWSYGEGSSQSYSSGPFFHDYATTGTYDVKLVVKDSYGCKDSASRPAYVSITKPAAKFTPSDTALCPSVPITFTNLSTGEGANYSWDFGDGTTSVDFSPAHSFVSSGSFKVRMVMIDKNGCTSSDSTVINIYAAKADFTLSESYSTCPPLVVDITNKSNNYTSLNWDFGDGGNSQLVNPSHIYTYPGHYTVKILVKNNGGCTDELTKSVVIEGPTGIFDYIPKEACNPGTLTYKITAQNTVNYIWDFNDGNTIFSVDPKVTHTYTNPGTYLPKIILQDKFGCQVPVKGLDTVLIHSIKTNLSSDTKVVCDSGYVLFSDSSTSDEAVNGFMWNFGDGTTSTEQNPKHVYADTGFYSVKLVTTTAFGCTDSISSKNYIKVVNSPVIRMPGDTSACEPARIRLTAEFVKTDTSAVTWSWNFGNGLNADIQRPDSQSYSKSGSYQVSVKATNSDGCAAEVSRTVVIHPIPVVDAGNNVAICRFDNFQLSATGADLYTWTKNSTLSCVNCGNPVAKPDSLTTYYVTGKTIYGCVNTDSVTINVHQPFTMLVDAADTLCKGESIHLKATGAQFYQWSPSLWLSSTNSATPTARPDSTITYQVVGSDNNGCFRDTQNVKIKVYPIPTIDITNGESILVQVGGSIKLNTVSSSDVVKWTWFPSEWLSCGSCAEPIALPKDKITYSVTATNDGKCAAKDQITINLICNNANVYMPNTFSPNGDGANDVYYPRGTGLYNILTFKIFNRWGQLVFQKNGVSANDPQYGWDGNLNGMPLQPDVYVYLLEVACSNNTIFPFKGNVTLIR